MLKRSLLSIGIGISITFFPMVVIDALGFSEKSKWDGMATAIAVLSYWPSWILHPPFTTIDCPNADSIADKLSCMWISSVISTVIYSILCFALLRWLANKKQAEV